MTKTQQVKALTEARNALLKSLKMIRNGGIAGAIDEDQFLDVKTNEAIGLIAQVREARGLD
jgi:hypothetical protein